MKKLLVFAAMGEAVTGLIFLAYPTILVWLLFGGEIGSAGVVMYRIAGISLIALGLACWPRRVGNRALSGMLTYSLLATLYLAYLGIGGDWVGKLFWPAFAFHAILTFILARAWLKDR